MKYLSYGTGRVVFKVDDNTVVKIPYNQSGVEQNRQEFEIYEKNVDSQAYARCNLTENGWLYMEYLEDCSLEYYNHDDKTHCSLYDDSTAKTLVFTCKADCISCEYNIFKPFTDDELLKIKTYKTKDRVQIGRDKNGIIKFYDYATISPESKLFLFDEAYLPLFMEYLDENDNSTLFSEWIQDKTLPKTMGNKDSNAKKANRFKRRLHIGGYCGE